MASLAAMDTPAKADSPASIATPYNKKQKSPEKSTPEKSKDAVELPSHYRRFVDDLRILDETLSIFRIKNQITFFSVIRPNIERVSGRRFPLDVFRQLMTVTGGELFKVEWQNMKDIEGKVIKPDLTIKAIDHENEGAEIFKRLNSDQTTSRKSKVVSFLESKLNEYLDQNPGNASDNAYPIKPFDLPEKPSEAGDGTPCSTPGRNRVLSKCDSVASDGSVVKTPKSSLRRQLSVSASPVMPNTLPQFITPVKLPQQSPQEDQPASKTPMSAKEKLEAIRNRIKAKEENDVKEAKAYDDEMARKERVDEYDLCVKLLIKLNHKFPRGITTAKLSTLKKDLGSLFVNPNDVERWTRKICDLVPARFQVEKIGEEDVLRLRTTDVKFSVIKKEIEDLKLTFQASINARE
jgi:hypothetical protein